VSGIVLGLVVEVIAKLAGGDPMAAGLQGVVIAYATWVLYGLYRLVRLFKESPQYISRPRFFWI
jgi:VIT1/CCC1 family predicted Fe2+/Mn2+ transporter